jgi:hypothetical protein
MAGKITSGVTYFGTSVGSRRGLASEALAVEMLS